MPTYLHLNFTVPLLNETLLLFTHVTAHPYRPAEFMIGVVSIQVFESLKGNLIDCESLRVII